MRIIMKQVLIHNDKVIGLSDCGTVYTLAYVGSDTYAWKQVKFIKAKTEDNKTE